MSDVDDTDASDEAARDERERIRERKRRRLRERLEGGDARDGTAGSDANGGGDAGVTEAPTEPVDVSGPEALQTLVDDHDVVLVDCYADWCGPCQMMEPTVEAEGRRRRQPGARPTARRAWRPDVRPLRRRTARRPVRRCPGPNHARRRDHERGRLTGAVRRRSAPPCRFSDRSAYIGGRARAAHDDGDGARPVFDGRPQRRPSVRRRTSGRVCDPPQGCSWGRQDHLRPPRSHGRPSRHRAVHQPRRADCLPP
jgi:hypothetical protein